MCEEEDNGLTVEPGVFVRNCPDEAARMLAELQESNRRLADENKAVWAENTKLNNRIERDEREWKRLKEICLKYGLSGPKTTAALVAESYEQLRAELKKNSQ